MTAARGPVSRLPAGGPRETSPTDGSGAAWHLESRLSGHLETIAEDDEGILRLVG